MVDLWTTSRTPGALRVGLGCGFVADLSYRASCALVESAYESGIRHFDVAPPYGDGLAERILGDVLSPVRESVTITTKAGLAHPPRVSPIRILRRVLLPLKRRVPTLWGGAATLRSRGNAEPRGTFGTDEIATSIGESLKRLKTGYLDFLLLHEVLPADVTDALLEVLAELRVTQQVRGIGLGTSVEASMQLLGERPACFDMIQVNHYWGAFRSGLAGRHLLLTHGCIRSGMRLIESPEFHRVSDADESLQDMRRVLTNPLQTPELLLAAGLRANREGMVLVSSSRPERLHQFIEVATSSRLDTPAAQLNRCFRKLCETMSPPG